MLFAEIGVGVWQVVAAIAVTFAVGYVLLMLYNRREKRRSHAIEIYGELSKWGLGKVAKPFLMYGAGDYSGLIQQIILLVERIHQKDGVVEMLTECFWKLLDHFGSDPVSKAKILEKLGAIPKPTVPPVVSSGE